MTDVTKDIEENVRKGEEVIEEIIDKGKKVVGKIAEEIEEKLSPKPKASGKKAEKESTSGEKSVEERKKALLEKAKKLKEKVETAETEDLKDQVKVKKKDMLIPLEEYVKSGIYLGTRVVTPSMKPFVYRRRADGLAIFNTDLIDEKIKEGIEYMSKFAPEDTILICKREAGWRAAKKLGELTGIRVFAKKYPAGILTNKALPDFFENELTIITDHWVDKNALNDTLKVKKKVLMVCDTNNFSKGANQIILGNNKSSRSLGLIFYLLTKGYCKARGIEADIPEIDWWTGEEDERMMPKKRRRTGSRAKFGV